MILLVVSNSLGNRDPRCGFCSLSKVSVLVARLQHQGQGLMPSHTIILVITQEVQSLDFLALSDQSHDRGPGRTLKRHEPVVHYLPIISHLEVMAIPQRFSRYSQVFDPMDKLMVVWVVYPPQVLYAYLDA